MMQKYQLQELITKYQNGQCSAEEIALLESWYIVWRETDRISLTETQLLKAQQRSLKDIDGIIDQHPSKKLWPKALIAAATIAMVVIGIYLYNPVPRPTPDLRSTFKNDVAPGKNTATLTLANGKIINLDTSKTSVIVSDSVKANTMLTAATPRAGAYQLVLPDGTRVWLNAESKITFPSQFTGSKREVTAEGEIYFEVAHNTAKPFIVKSQHQQVEVLGTHFNLSSYENEGSIKTSLFEGSVRVTQTSDARKEIILKPNQQASNSHKKLTIKYVDEADVLDWKNDGFAFSGGDFAAAMRKIARWYNVEIIYDPSDFKEIEIGGFISRKNNLSEVLKFIESTGQVWFAVEGRRVLVRN